MGIKHITPRLLAAAVLAALLVESSILKADETVWQGIRPYSYGSSQRQDEKNNLGNVLSFKGMIKPVILKTPPPEIASKMFLDNYPPLNADLYKPINVGGADQRASFQVNYMPNGAKSPNDSKITCLTYPEYAKPVLQAAINIWSTYLNSKVVIRINACWTNLGNIAAAQAAPASIIANVPNQPFVNTYYPIALANALAGVDMDATKADINVDINSTAQGSPWYFGTDGKVPSNSYDLLSAILHELGHGFGLTGITYYNNGVGMWDAPYYKIPYVYESLLVDGSNRALTNKSVYPNPSLTLGKALVSNNLWFNGLGAKTANGGSKVKIFAPTTWNTSSLYHLDDSYINGSNGLMTRFTPAPGHFNHNVGSIAIEMLKDMGWGKVKVTPPSTVTTIAPSGTIATRTPTYTWYATGGADEYRLYIKDSSGKVLADWWLTKSQTNCSSGTGSCFYKPNGTLPPNTYNWWVQAKNSGGTSPWSAIRSFIVK